MVYRRYGSISKNNITKTCETKFGAKLYRDSEKGRGLIFNQKTLNKLVVNYSIIDGIKIIKEEEEKKKEKEKEDSTPQNPNDTYDTYDTFREGIEQNNQDNSLEDSTKTPDLTSNDEEKIQENHDSKLKTNENNVEKTNTYSPEVSYLSFPSYDTTNAKDLDSLSKIQQLTTSQQSMALKEKIKTGLFTNPLISESDLSNANYNPKIINNINRLYPNSDRWFCNNCTMRGDKWFMMKHPCKNNINNKGGSKLI